jgi:dTDP-glucose 4,6-dehydratase
LGNPNEISLKILRKKFLKITGASVRIVYKPLPADDPKQRPPDITKAKNILGWQPLVGRAEGLKKTYEIFQKPFQRRMA